MRTRDLLRFVPGLSRLVRSLDTRERESQLLTEECRRLAVENHRLKAAAPQARTRTAPVDELPLPSRLQAHWMGELRRVLKPSGVLLLSLHGDATVGHLSRSERADYRAGRLVVRGGDLAGTNHCAAFHPPAYVRGEFARGFEVLE